MCTIEVSPSPPPATFLSLHGVEFSSRQSAQAVLASAVGHAVVFHGYAVWSVRYLDPLPWSTCLVDEVVLRSGTGQVILSIKDSD